MKTSMATLILLLAFSTQAHAGKLADGFRGLPFGDVSMLSVAPLPGCQPDPEPNVRWLCDTEVGGVPVTVTYIVQEGIFYGVGIFVTGTTNARALRLVFTQAYGTGRKIHDYDTSDLADWLWTDSTVVAGWQFNQFTEEGLLVMYDKPLSEEVKRLEAKRAAGSVNDL